VAGDIPDQYKKDFQYLKQQSDRGTLLNTNAIYKILDEKAKNLPGLRRALNTLDVKYV
jgi:hypothetical protein